MLDPASLPCFDEWDSILGENKLRQEVLSNIELRKLVVDEALKYVQEIGSELKESIEYTGQPLVLTGHQPVIYHGGILYKNYSLEKYVNSRDVIGLNITIDTDVADGGKIFYPVSPISAPKIKSFSISDDPNSSFLFQKITDKYDIEQCFEIVTSEFVNLGLNEKLPKIERVKNLYKDSCGANLVDANTKIRRILTKYNAQLELPLSRLLSLPIFQQTLSLFLEDFINVYFIYNKVLNQFRKNNGIKNKANPFPDLRQQGDLFETLFWVIDAKGRYSLHCKEDNSVIKIYAGNDFIADIPKNTASSYADFVPGKFLIAPKAVLITYLLRYILSNLFIHGVGGCKYDVFTDYFIGEYLGYTSPAFVSCSTDEYLFPEKVQKLKNINENKHILRDAIYHPHNHERLFSDDILEDILILSGQKNELIKGINSSNAKKDKREYAIKLKAIDRKIKEMIESNICLELDDDLLAFESFFSFREFPYFMTSETI